MANRLFEKSDIGKLALGALIGAVAGFCGVSIAVMMSGKPFDHVAYSTLQHGALIVMLTLPGGYYGVKWGRLHRQRSNTGKVST